MVEWNVKKVLAFRVCKTFRVVKTFLVERFTAKSFFVSFFDEKSDIKEKTHTVYPPKTTRRV